MSHYLIAKINAGTIKDFETWIKVYNVYEVIVHAQVRVFINTTCILINIKINKINKETVTFNR